MENFDTGTDDLLCTISDGIALITLNRPEARNALTNEMAYGLQSSIEHIELNSKVRAVVLTGAGKGFCAGGDVNAMAAVGDDGEPKSLNDMTNEQRLLQRRGAGGLFKLTKPTIAALPGAAAGAGLSLALACDLRIMASNAILTTAFGRVGLSGDYGGSYFLTQLVGTAKARELYYLSDRVTAAEALELSLTNWVCEPDELMDRTMEIAQRLATGPTMALRAMKENLNQAMDVDIDAYIDAELTRHMHCTLTEDHREAVAAFGEKRAPEFTGK